MKKQSSKKHPRELSAQEIDYTISYAPKGVTKSSDLSPCHDIIGQDRAIDAIRAGLNVSGIGYNIFVTGMTGTGRTTTIKHLLEVLEKRDPELLDICYVNNFKNTDYPRVLMFKAGEGRRFKKDMDYLISSLRKIVPKVFLSEDYKDRYTRIMREFEGRQKELIGGYEEDLTKAGFVMVQIQSSLGTRSEIQPLIDGEPQSLEKLERLTKEGKFSASQLDELRRRWDSLRRDFDTTTVESKKLTAKLEDAIEKLNNAMITPLVTDKINLIKKRYPGEKTTAYLTEVEDELVSDIDRFREAQPRRGEEEPPAHRKREPFEDFSVNLILDNAEAKKMPVIIEKSPSYKNLFGSLERVVDRFGYWRTDFTRIFAGSLLKATGGYLVINAVDLLVEPGAWHYLKRALKHSELEIAGYDPFYMMAGSGIKPEPIPLDVKVVLIGEPRIYHLLFAIDDEFKEIFKIKAEFDSTMALSDESLALYYRFVCRTLDEEQLPEFDISAMQAVAEFGMRLAGRRDKLTTRFAAIQDLIRESVFYCRERGAPIVTREDVAKAIVKKRTRVNLIEMKIQEMFDSDVIMVSTDGAVAGQINGLSVYQIGDFSFGRPARITVSTSLGRAGIINIERESDLSGPIHNKGVLVLSGYLRKLFSQDKPLSMSASISFEQSYSGVDGDSASSTELYAILSSLCDLGINQGIAVTGSVNQNGDIQPIGGVNDKIEGFYDVCNAKGLTGRQGVIIPSQNVPELLLRPDVRRAIADKQFHLYPVSTIAEGITILTDTPAGEREKNGKFTAGSVFALVDAKLHQMALDLQYFGQNNHPNRSAKSSTVAKKSKSGSSRKPQPSPSKRKR